MDVSTIISFPGVSDAEANKLAGSLSLVLRETDQSVSVGQRRANPESQDFGATLAIILGTPALVAVAKGIATWLARNSGTNIEIHAPDGTSVKVTHAGGCDIARTVAAALSGKR
jgi:Effector Associated Constant Component 1